MEVQLRAATIGDARSVADVIVRSRDLFLPFAPLAHSAEQISQWVEKVLIPDEEVAVAVREIEVLGVISTCNERGVTWVNQLYVDPSHVSKGLGTKLLTYALANVSSVVKLYTFQENVGARRFYQRYGFVEVAFSNGAANEEQCPDVLCVRAPAA